MHPLHLIIDTGGDIGAIRIIDSVEGVVVEAPIGRIAPIAIVHEDLVRADMVGVEVINGQVVRGADDTFIKFDGLGDVQCSTASGQHQLPVGEVLGVFPPLIGDRPERVVLGRGDLATIDGEVVQVVEVDPQRCYRPCAGDPRDWVRGHDQVTDLDV